MTKHPFQILTDDKITIRGSHFPATGSGSSLKNQLQILCLPGLTRSERDFHPLAQALQKQGFEVYCLSFRGRGQSDRAPQQTYTTEQETKDVINVMDHFGFKKAAIIGTSRGGIVAMTLAQTHPERISKIVLNDIGAMIPREGLQKIISKLKYLHVPQTFTQAYYGFKFALKNEFPDLSEKELKALVDTTYAAGEKRPVIDYDTSILEQLKESTEQLEDDINLWPLVLGLESYPVLLIRGETSTLLSEKTEDEMKQALPNMQAHLVKGQGHAPLLMDQPSISRIIDFLNQPEDPQTKP